MDSTAGRLEFFLLGLSNKFGYEGVFRSTPSEVVFGLREGPDSPQRLELVATPAPGVDLDKLARLGDLLNELKAGTTRLADCPDRLDAIDKVSPPWGKFASMLGYAFTGIGLVPLLGGGWLNALFGTLFSILVYMMRSAFHVWDGKGVGRGKGVRSQIGNLGNCCFWKLIVALFRLSSGSLIELFEMSYASASSR